MSRAGIVLPLVRDESVASAHGPALLEVVREPRAWLLNSVTALFVSFCFAGYIVINFITPIRGLPNHSDFGVYYRAAQAVLRGQSPYENPECFYPPLVAFLMSPFGLIDELSARWIWYLLCHALLLVAAWALWRSAGRGRVLLCSIALVWAFGGAAKETLDVGQLSPLLVLALALSYSSHQIQCGVAAATGFIVKYLPGVIALAMVMNRRRRAITSFIALAVAGTLIPWLVLVLGFSGPKRPLRAHYWMGTPDLFSWSVPSVILRLFDPIVEGAARIPANWEHGHTAALVELAPLLRWISAAVGVLTLVIGIAVVLWVFKGRLSYGQYPWVLAGLVSLSLAAAPVCWTHYQVLQYPGIAVMLALSVRARKWLTALAITFLFASAYLLPEAALIYYHDHHNGWTLHSPSTLYFWSTCPVIATFGLFVLSLWQAQRLGGIALPESRA